MALDVLLRPATEADLPALARLELLAFATPNWTVDVFERFECSVAEMTGDVVAFLVARQVFSGTSISPAEREILNLAVSPAHLRLGLASRLLEHELRHQATFFLEVRESNHAARALYERFGFAEVSRRRDYYDNPPETAIVMLRRLS